MFKKGWRFKIKKYYLKKSIIFIIFIFWFVAVYMFSNQTGAESGKVSEKVTKKLLQTKDALEIVEDTYKETNEIVIRGVQTNPITKKRVDKWEVPVRKLAHYGLFLCGGFIIYILIHFGFSIQKNSLIISIFMGLLIACSDEFHQLYTLNRTPKLLDVGIDTVGVITGVLISVMVRYVFEKMKKNIYVKESINLH